MMRIIFLIYFYILVSPSAHATTGLTDSLFTEAVSKQRNGSFREAADLYIDIWERGRGSAGLFNNLALCYAELEDIPQAIWACEQCLLYRPFSASCRSLLEQLQLEIDSYRSAIPRFILFRWYTQFSLLMPSTYWSVLSIVFMLLACLLIYRGKRLGYFLIFPIILTVLFGLRKKQIEYADHVAIVMTDLELRQGPDSESTVIYPIDRGTKVRILDTFDGFYEVRLLNFDEGWIEAAEMRKISR